MNRRTFLQSVSAGAAAASAAVFQPVVKGAESRPSRGSRRNELAADVVIAGGGLGGCAAALGALRNGLRVILTEETDWVGGQLTSQAVPPDEHRWIESHGCTQSYRALRNGIRDYYRRHYPLTDAARNTPNLNPGDGAVSRLCHEPRVALAVLESMLAPWISQGKLTLLLEHKVTKADVARDNVRSLQARDLRTGRQLLLHAPFFHRCHGTG